MGSLVQLSVKFWDTTTFKWDLTSLLPIVLTGSESYKDESALTLQACWRGTHVPQNEAPKPREEVTEESSA